MALNKVISRTYADVHLDGPRSKFTSIDRTYNDPAQMARDIVRECIVKHEKAQARRARDLAKRFGKPRPVEEPSVQQVDEQDDQIIADVIESITVVERDTEEDYATYAEAAD